MLATRGASRAHPVNRSQASRAPPTGFEPAQPRLEGRSVDCGRSMTVVETLGGPLLCQGSSALTGLPYGVHIVMGTQQRELERRGGPRPGRAGRVADAHRGRASWSRTCAQASAGRPSHSPPTRWPTTPPCDEGRVDVRPFQAKGAAARARTTRWDPRARNAPPLVVLNTNSSGPRPATGAPDRRRGSAELAPLAIRESWVSPRTEARLPLSERDEQVSTLKPNKGPLCA